MDCRRVEWMAEMKALWKAEDNSDPLWTPIPGWYPVEIEGWNESGLDLTLAKRFQSKVIVVKRFGSCVRAILALIRLAPLSAIPSFPLLRERGFRPFPEIVYWRIWACLHSSMVRKRWYSYGKKVICEIERFAWNLGRLCFALLQNSRWK